VVLWHLGAAHHAAGDVAAGRRYLERALAAPEAFPGREEARRLLTETG
jgi:hypothetical protein